MHYLDHSATTPVLPEVRELMLTYLGDDFGNPASVHSYGRKAKEAVEVARERFAQAVGASPSEIVFTGGGTEADNLAIKGAAEKLAGAGRHIIVSAFEHHGVLDAAHYLERHGFEVTICPIEPSGHVSPTTVASLVRKDTIIVSVMAVNNEIGTIQDLQGISEAVKAVNPRTLIHTDAVQALGNVPIDLHGWGVDLAAFSAHKIGGPKGVGACFIRAGVPVEAVIHGGGQEKGLRSGTLNVPGISALGLAAEIAAKEVDEKVERLLPMKMRMLEGIKVIVPNVVINGGMDDRVAGNLNICIPGTEGETLLLLLDQAGFAASSGSACQSGALDPSHVLLSIGVPRELAQGSLRFTLGRASTEDDVDALLDAFPDIVERARKAG